MNVKAAILAAACAFVAAGTAQAATCTQGAISYTLTVADSAACFSGNDLGANGIDKKDLSIFGYSDWVLGNSTDAPGDGTVSFLNAPAEDVGSGTWSISGYGNYSSLMIVLKSATTFAAFQISDVLSGSWSIVEEKSNKKGTFFTPKDLSHASLYYSPSLEVATPAPVPLPAAAPLLIAGIGALGGLAAARRRRRAV